MLTWDAENRLTRVRRYSSGGTLQTDVQFAYDGFGRRVKKVLGGTLTLFVWDGRKDMNDMEAHGLAGTLQIDHAARCTLHGARCTVHDKPDGHEAPEAIARQGNVYRVDNTSGAAQSSYRYRAWGDRYQVGTESYQSRLTYKGREEDRETGLIYMRHRYYSPRLERFVNEDPIGTAGGGNVYVFGGNRPCEGADPMGLWWDSQIPFSSFNYYGDQQSAACVVETTLGDAVMNSSVAAEFQEAVAEAIADGYDPGDFTFGPLSTGRTSQEQATLKARDPSAASPGTGSHEAGLAADLPWVSARAGHTALVRAMNRHGFYQLPEQRYRPRHHFQHESFNRSMIRGFQEAIRAAGGKHNLPRCQI